MIRTSHIADPEDIGPRVREIEREQQTTILHIAPYATYMAYADGHFIAVLTNEQEARRILIITTPWSWPLRTLATLMARGARGLNYLAVALDHRFA